MRSTYNQYTGFIPASNPIDWAKLTGGLVSTITGIGEEREAKRQALDKLQSDNTRILQNTELGKSQSLNQLILSGSNDGRQSMMEWNRQLKAGQINPVEYKNRINNLMDSWSTFANTAKSYDQQMQEALKRQQEGLGSGLELELNNRISQLGDLRNKKVQIDPNNGNFVIGQLDQNGLFDPTSIIDLRSISKPGNVMDNKVDLASIADEKTEGIASWIIETGNTTVTDALQNPAVQRTIYDLTQSILSNPRAITSILTDNTDGNYDFYYSDQDLYEKIQDRINKENDFRRQNNKPVLSGNDVDQFIESEKEKFIFLTQDDQGVYQPNLTENQIKEANRATNDAIKSRLTRKVEIDEPYRGGSSGGGGGGSSKSKKDESKLGVASKVFNAWRNNDAKALSQASGGKLVFQYTKDGGVNVYNGNPNDRNTKLLNPGGSIKKIEDLYTYFYGDSEGSQVSWIDDMQKLRQGGGSKAYSSAQEANIKATLKANPGASRADVIKALGY
jgi:hypothetical protein